MKKLLIFLLLLLLLIPLASAEPPFESETFEVVSEGLEIAYPEIRLVKQGSTVEFDFHVFNATNGLPMTNDTTSCYFQLNNNTGNHLHEINKVDFSQPYDFTVTVDGINFTDEGYYFYTFQCNTSNIGGFVEENFRVTADGKDESEAKSLKIIAALLGILILVIAFLVLAFKLDEQHYLLKIFFIIISLISLTMIPQIIISGVSSVKLSLLKMPMRALYAFCIYLSVYIIYNWAINSERFLRWFGKQK